MRIFFIIIFWLAIHNLAYGQNAVTQAAEVLMEIAQMQVKHDEFYDAGLFPSQRSWITGSSEDNNIFVTASIAYILRYLKPEVPYSSQVVIDSILARVQPLFPLYYSRRKKAAYNFWQTVPPDLPFPNGGALLSREEYRLPDDYDDTSLVRLAAGSDSLIDRDIRDRMITYAMREDRGAVEKTLRKYQNSKAYEVFFADKMAQEYDVVVMCNTLLFVFERGFELEEIDRLSIRFIEEVINARDHWHHPQEIAPSYRSTVWILYHLSRLIAADSGHLPTHLKDTILQDLLALLNDDLSNMERMLICSSLLRLGEDVKLNFTPGDIREELDEFVFFHAKLSDVSWVPTMKWRSQAFNLTLYYEYLILSSRME